MDSKIITAKITTTDKNIVALLKEVKNEIESIFVTSGKHVGRGVISKTKYGPIDVTVILIYFNSGNDLLITIFDKNDVNFTFNDAYFDLHEINADNIDWFKDLMFRAEVFYDDYLPDMIYEII